MGKKTGKTENVQVVVRMRPFNARELREQGEEAVKLDLATGAVFADGKQFTFDAVYNNSFTQKHIYTESVAPVVETVLAGYNSTVFSYGQSGSGKTWTTTGPTDLADPASYGLAPNALEHIFDYIRADTASADSNVEYQVMVSFTELYLGKCRDLLRDGDVATNLELRENAQKLFYVKDLSVHVIDNMKSGMRLMLEGLNRREVKSTKLNNDSSRSHAVFSITIRKYDKLQDTRTEAKLLIVDLAGSERQAKTEAEGAALQEGSAINQSLTALGTVIDCLVKQKPHIPYRSSPLTMLLKDGLGGGSRTLIFGCISPSSTNLHETVSTLRFVDRAKQIKNKPRIQMDPKDARIHELTEELAALKKRFGLSEDGDAEGDGDGEGGGAGGGAAGDEGGGEGADADAKRRYAKSFEGEIEALKTRVEELEVQLTEARESLERAVQELSTVESRCGRERDELRSQLAAARAETQSVKDAQQLEQSVAGGSVREQLRELQLLCTNFVATLDPDGTALSGGVPLKRGVDLVTVETLTSAFNHIETNLLTSSTSGSFSASPERGGRKGDVVMSPVLSSLTREESSPGLGLLSRRRSFAGKNMLSEPVTPAPVTPASPPGGKKQPPAPPKQLSPAPPSTSSVAEATAAAATDGGKLDDAVLQDCVKQLATAVAGGDGGGKEKQLRDALEDILLRQRLAVHRSMFAVLQNSGGGNGNGKAPAPAAPDASVLAAYDHANDEIERLTEAMVRQKQLAAKAKEIADKRAAEAQQLSQQVAQLREEAVRKHAAHAAELELVQANLVAAQNRKLEKLTATHQKDLKAERRQRDALQARIDGAERERDAALQRYDVLVMEHEQLLEAHEQQKVEALRQLRQQQHTPGSARNGTTPASASGLMLMDDTFSSTGARDTARLHKLRADVNRVQQQQQQGSSSTNGGASVVPTAASLGTPRNAFGGVSGGFPAPTSAASGAAPHVLPPMGGGGGGLPPLQMTGMAPPPQVPRRGF